ncbi:MAG: hypothetical protein ACI9R3_006066 [Verrucomicrobiales bacterium]|jgi:hypothetical protein
MTKQNLLICAGMLIAAILGFEVGRLFPDGETAPSREETTAASVPTVGAPESLIDSPVPMEN